MIGKHSADTRASAFADRLGLGLRLCLRACIGPFVFADLTSRFSIEIEADVAGRYGTVVLGAAILSAIRVSASLETAPNGSVLLIYVRATASTLENHWASFPNGETNVKEDRCVCPNHHT